MFTTWLKTDEFDSAISEYNRFMENPAMSTKQKRLDNWRNKALQAESKLRLRNDTAQQLIDSLRATINRLGSNTSSPYASHENLAMHEYNPDRQKELEAEIVSNRNKIAVLEARETHHFQVLGGRNATINNQADKIRRLEGSLRYQKFINNIQFGKTGNGLHPYPMYGKGIFGNIYKEVAEERKDAKQTEKLQDGKFVDLSKCCEAYSKARELYTQDVWDVTINKCTFDSDIESNRIDDGKRHLLLCSCGRYIVRQEDRGENDGGDWSWTTEWVDHEQVAAIGRQIALHAVQRAEQHKSTNAGPMYNYDDTGKQHKSYSDDHSG